jgi:hypothetical protein
MTAHPGNGYPMREKFLREGWARPKSGLADAAD